MGIIYFMIGVSVFIALIFLAAYFWAVKDGQFDDDETPSHRILFEDELIENKRNKSE